MKLLFVSLGCDKNLVDSEEMLGLLTGNGFEIVDDETEAEAIVVNTAALSMTQRKRASTPSLRWQNTRKPGAVKSWLSQDVWHSVIRMRSLRKYRK